MVNDVNFIMILLVDRQPTNDISYPILPNPISPNPVSPNPISPNPVSPNPISPNPILRCRLNISSKI
jgi:hypothetical protein